MNTVTALTYFLSGVAKVTEPLRWQWAGGEELRAQVAVDGLRKELLGGAAPRLANALYKHVTFYRVTAIGTLVVELLAPVMILDRRLARLWAVNAFLMDWGIYFIMKIKFRYQLSGLIYAPFFDLDRLVMRLMRPRSLP